MQTISYHTGDFVITSFEERRYMKYGNLRRAGSRSSKNYLSGACATVYPREFTKYPYDSIPTATILHPRIGYLPHGLTNERVKHMLVHLAALLRILHASVLWLTQMVISTGVLHVFIRRKNMGDFHWSQTLNICDGLAGNTLNPVWLASTSSVSC